MAHEEEKQEQYSDEDLDNMRKEILAWMDDREKRKSKKRLILPIINRNQKQIKAKVEKAPKKIEPEKNKKINLPAVKKSKKTQRVSIANFLNYTTPEAFIGVFTRTKKSASKILKKNIVSKPLKVSVKTKSLSAPIKKNKKEIVKQRKSPLPKDVKTRVFLIFIFGFITIVLFLSLVSTSIYALHLNNSITRAITKILPFPAVTIDNTIIYYNDYTKLYSSLKHISSQEVGEKSLRQKTVNKMIEDNILFAVSKENSVEASNKEINEALAQIIHEAGSEKQFEEFIQTFYGWGVDDFVQYILRPSITRQKLYLHLGKSGAETRLIKEKSESNIIVFIK